MIIKLLFNVNSNIAICIASFAVLGKNNFYLQVVKEQKIYINTY